MYVVLGATGHVGGAVANTLLAAGHPVTVVTRSAQKAETWKRKGASAAVVDIQNTKALADVFQHATRVFLLNPPADVAEDTDREERRTVQLILAGLEGLEGLSFEKIVVQSTYGAQPGMHCGDLGVLYDFEEGVRALGQPFCCIRAAYYMSNWLLALQQARETGHFSTLLPAVQKVPMVAPEDVGALAARLLMSPAEETGVYACEGPYHYAPQDVAAVFTNILGKDVHAETIPKGEWLAYYRQNGFSEQAAHSYAHMTELFVDQRYDQPENPQKGPTDLMTYFSRLAVA